MKYKITETQLNNLSEISVGQGKISFSPSYDDIFSLIANKLGKGKIKKYIKTYFKDVVGYKLDDSELSDVVNNFNWIELTNLPKNLRNKDILPNLAYFLVKNVFGLSRLGSLEVYKHKVGRGYFGDTEYYFFDPELEISVGKVSGEKNTNGVIGKYWAISTSGVDKGLVGRGYGKEMYLAILEDVKILASDRTLYGDSLNIWVNVLPKYVSVFAEFDDGVMDKFVKIGPRTKVLDHENVNRYYATKDEKVLSRFSE